MPSRVKWTKEQLSSAMEVIRSGKSCREAALISGIPTSTLIRYKSNSTLSQIFEIPQTDLHGGRTWTKEQLGFAMKAISSGMQHQHASLAFGIPRRTLTRYMRNLKRKRRGWIAMEESSALGENLSVKEECLEPDHESVNHR